VSCYFRHIKNILDEADIEVTPGNKKDIDRAFHRIVGVTYKDCPATWKKLKQDLAGDAKRRLDLIQKLKNAVH